MILKIVRNWGSGKNPAQEVVVECDRYDRRGADATDSQVSNMESMFGDEDGKVEPTCVLTAIRHGRPPEFFLLGHANVYIMNNEGKTIDTIFA